MTGHTTAIEAVRFSPTEELVCAGSVAGAVKVWDLEAARMVRTLTGHRAGIKALDFHPYGDFLATGSTDTNIKVSTYFSYKKYVKKEEKKKVKYSSLQVERCVKSRISGLCTHPVLNRLLTLYFCQLAKTHFVRASIKFKDRSQYRSFT